jgi:hypothetical protein
VKLSQEDIDRFWAKVDRSGAFSDVDDSCWLWTAGCVNGYGHFWLNVRMEKAHRISYFLAYGPIPEGLLVRHTCDNPPCVRPKHLLVGTHTDNIKDREDRGRGNQSKGSAHGKAKLTEADIPVIRERYKTETLQAIADDYGVFCTVISKAVRRKTWRHVE